MSLLKKIVGGGGLSCDVSDRIRHETTLNRKRSCNLAKIGTLTIHSHTTRDCVSYGNTRSL